MSVQCECVSACVCVCVRACVRVCAASVCALPALSPGESASAEWLNTGKN